MAGLIYGAIVVMWLAFLVPMWLRRHDEASEAKSVDRFSTAMKVLARRTTAPDVGVAGSVSAGLHGTGATAVGAMHADAVADSADTTEHSPLSSRVGAAGRAFTAGTASAGHRINDLVARRRHREQPASVAGRGGSSVAVRRQRVLAILGGLTVVLSVLAGLSFVPWLAVVPAVVLLVGYLVLLRVMARRSLPAPVRSRRPAEALGAEQGEDRFEPGTRTEYGAESGTRIEYGVVHTVKVNPAPVRRGESLPATELTGTLPAASAVSAVSASPVAAPDGFVGPRVGWDPVPVPSPTYVSAPRAERAVRSIDLSSDGAWTSGRLVADAKAAAAAAVARTSAPGSQPARRAVGD